MCRIQQTLKNGILNPLAIVDTLLRNLPQSSAASGILTGGDQGLDPQGQASRAELAAMLARFCQNFEE